MKPDNGHANGAITWTNERRRLSDLIPWPRNPRQIKKDQAERLANSFDEFGQVETLAIGPGNEIYNGHQRLNVLAAENGPLPEGLGHEVYFEGGKVPEPSVDQARRFGRDPRREVPLFEEQRGKAPERRVPGNARARDPPADDDEVENPVRCWNSVSAQ